MQLNVEYSALHLFLLGSSLSLPQSVFGAVQDVPTTGLSTSMATTEPTPSRGVKTLMAPWECTNDYPCPLGFHCAPGGACLVGFGPRSAIAARKLINPCASGFCYDASNNQCFIAQNGVPCSDQGVPIILTSSTTQSPPAPTTKPAGQPHHPPDVWDCGPERPCADGWYCGSDNMCSVGPPPVPSATGAAQKIAAFVEDDRLNKPQQGGCEYSSCTASRQNPDSTTTTQQTSSTSTTTSQTSRTTTTPWRFRPPPEHPWKCLDGICLDGWYCGTDSVCSVGPTPAAESVRTGRAVATPSSVQSEKRQQEDLDGGMFTLVQPSVVTRTRTHNRRGLAPPMWGCRGGRLCPPGWFCGPDEACSVGASVAAAASITAIVKRAVEEPRDAKPSELREDGMFPWGCTGTNICGDGFYCANGYCLVGEAPTTLNTPPAAGKLSGRDEHVWSCDSINMCPEGLTCMDGRCTIGGN